VRLEEGSSRGLREGGILFARRNQNEKGKEMLEQDIKRVAEEMDALGYKKAANIILRQQEEIQLLQEQFDRAIEFLAKANNWSKQ